jgi:DNA-binding LytR/AlgR family response regulator
MIKFTWNSDDFESFKEQLKDMKIEENDCSHEISITIDPNDASNALDVLELATYLQSRISFETINGWTMIFAKSIMYIESFGEEIFMHLDHKETIQVKHPLYELEQMLSKFHVVRIGKSFLVNLMKIKLIETTLNAKLELTLIDGSKLEVSRSYVKRFKDALGI